MVNLSTIYNRTIFRGSVFFLVLASFFGIQQKASAQMSVYADFSWPCYAEENLFYIIAPDGWAYLGYFCNPNYCYYNDLTNTSYYASNVYLGDLPWECGSYTVQMYDAYGDSWNCGGTITLRVNGINVGTFGKTTAGGVVGEYENQ